VRVKILEIDSERRRLSLSIKRVEGQVLPVRPIITPVDGEAGDLDDMPELGLSEDVFSSAETEAIEDFAPAGPEAPDGAEDVPEPEAAEPEAAPLEAAEPEAAPLEAMGPGDAEPEDEQPASTNGAGADVEQQSDTPSA
jgi:small subunit ribosomal protein S1